MGIVTGVDGEKGILHTREHFALRPNPPKRVETYKFDSGLDGSAWKDQRRLVSKLIWWENERDGIIDINHGIRFR